MKKDSPCVTGLNILYYICANAVGTPCQSRYYTVHPTFESKAKYNNDALASARQAALTSWAEWAVFVLRLPRGD